MAYFVVQWGLMLCLSQILAVFSRFQELQYCSTMCGDNGRGQICSSVAITKLERLRVCVAGW